MATRGIYVRLAPELVEEIRHRAQAQGGSISATVESLTERGLKESGLEERAQILEEENETLKARTRELESEKVRLEGQLVAYSAKEAVWKAAQSRSSALENEVRQLQSDNQQLRNYIQLNVASCLSCGARLRLWDIGQAQCWNCHKWQPKWLESYTPAPTLGDAILGAVVAGGTALAVVALLNALGGQSGNDGGRQS